MRRVCAWCGILAAASWSFAGDLNEIAEDQAPRIAALLVQKVASAANLPAKVDVDTEKSRGLYDGEDPRGLMLVPMKDLKEDRDNPALSKDKGLPIAYLFLFNLLPEKVDDKASLLKIDFTDNDGNEREIRLAVVTVKKHGDEDFRLHFWGVDGKQVAEARIGDADVATKEPMDVRASGDELQIGLLGRYGSKLTLKTSKY